MPRYIVGDDLTGANDAGVQFAKRGADVVVWLDHEHPYAGTADFVVLDTDSRSLSAPAAYERVRTLAGRLGPLSPDDVVKKIDSTLRGQLGAETRALLDEIPGAFAIVCPAYPKNGRTSRDGILAVHGTRVDETDLAHDLFSPVRDARIEAHIDEDCAAIGIDTVRAGSGAFDRAIDSAKAGSLRIAVVDAETDDDLATVAGLQARRRDILWVGSAGLIERLNWGTMRRPKRRASVPPGAILFLIGSLNAMTRSQVDAFKLHAFVEEVDPLEILRAAPAVNAAIERIRRVLQDGKDALLAVVSEREAVAAALAFGAGCGWSMNETGERLRGALAAAAEPLVHNRPGATFVLSGGDVARAFCNRFGVRGLSLVCELAPGIALGRPFGADMSIVTKAGGFGHPESYRQILDVLKAKVRQ